LEKRESMGGKKEQRKKNNNKRYMKGKVERCVGLKEGLKKKDQHRGEDTLGEKNSYGGEKKKDLREENLLYHRVPKTNQKKKGSWGWG